MATGQWDISNASYAAKSMSVSTQDGTPLALAFSSDGMKAYIVGSVSTKIFQYTLSTAWDISSGSYASKSLSVSTEDSNPQGLTFSADGTKAYVSGYINKVVYQYTLSIAWDISTGSYASKSMSVSAQTVVLQDVTFSSDGTKAYVSDSFNKAVYQYTLSTAWDISSGSYASKSLSVSTEDSSPRGLTFSADGTAAYIVGGTNDTIFQYTLSTAWDVSSGSYTSKSLSVTSQETNPQGMAFSSDGTTVYVVGNVNSTVYQYDLALLYELTGTVKDPSGVAIANAEVLILKAVAQDVSTGSYASKSLSVSSEDTSPYGVAFSSDGTKAYVVGSTNTKVFQYTLSTAWDASTGSYASKSMSVSTEDSSPIGLAFSSDGTKCYVTGNTNNSVYQYTLSIAWDISTGSYASKSMSTTAQDVAPTGVAFSFDGTKCYVTGVANNTIYQYTLSIAWDISTGSYASKSMSVLTETTNTYGAAFSSDGTKCYVAGNSNKVIYQYTLSTAWDISTGSYVSKSMSVSTEDSSPIGLAFSSDGTKCYVTGNGNKAIYQYKLLPVAVVGSETANGSGIYAYTSTAVETDLQVITSTVGPPRRFGASDNNLSTS